MPSDLELRWIAAIVGVVGGLLFFLVVAPPRDEERIRKDLAGRGCTLESAVAPKRYRHWGAGGRIYEVRYRDAEGRLHAATCMTNAWAGVYWKDDGVVP